MSAVDMEFERWFALQNQTIGKRMARAAWEYQQVRIVIMKSLLEEKEFTDAMYKEMAKRHGEMAAELANYKIEQEKAMDWISIETQLPAADQPIYAEINYMGKFSVVSGVRSSDEPRVVLYDFYSGTGGSVIRRWKPRELPNLPDAHPWTGIENKGL
jgi:hypothetical protein